MQFLVGFGTGVLALAALATIYLTFFRKERRLVWCALRPTSMMAVAEDLTDEVSIQFKQATIQDLTKFAFVIENAGQKPLKGDEIVTPLTWDAPGRVLGAKITKSDSTVTLHYKSIFDSKNVESPHRVEIRWDLFNPGTKVLLETLVAAPYSTGDEEKVRAEIVDISEIDFRWTTAGQLGGLTKGEGINNRWLRRRPFHYRYGEPVIYLVLLGLVGVVVAIGMSSTVIFGGWAVGWALSFVLGFFWISFKLHYPAGR